MNESDESEKKKYPLCENLNIDNKHIADKMREIKRQRMRNKKSCKRNAIQCETHFYVCKGVFANKRSQLDLSNYFMNYLTESSHRPPSSSMENKTLTLK